MEKFIKQYSYNQIIEQHDVLVMTLEQLIQSKDQLSNPKVIVCVDREGGVRKPKMPEWFKQGSETVYEKKQPAWFKQGTEEVYEKQPPKGFQSYKKEADARFEKIEARLDKVEAKLDSPKAPKGFTDYMAEFAKKNNLKL